MRSAVPAHRFLVPFLSMVLVILYSTCASAQTGNGKLQIHHIDVGQGDGALIVSPQGQTVLVDDGTYTNCSPFVNYITGLDVTDFDYNFVSHYHADHIGCLDDLLSAGVVLNIAGYDRGYSYDSATYTSYVTALGTKRVTIAKNQTITLDAGAENPVTIKCVDLNGAGVYPVDGSDENSKSVVLRVTYGSFDEVMGGDLTGDDDNDVETTVGPMVNDVEVYKVHHHGSATSSTDSWLNATTPEVGIISVGSNSYGHPTSDALTRLHNHNVKTYWTEIGSGTSPVEGWDKVGGTILIQAEPDPGAAYTVSGTGFTDTYYSSGGSFLTKTYYPTGVVVLVGTVGSGGYQDLAADDANYLVVGAVKAPRKYCTDWYGTTTITEDPVELTITYNGSYSTNRTQTLYAYNFTTSSWIQIDEASVGTSDVTRVYMTTSTDDFVSPSGEIRVRVEGGSNPRPYSCRGDYLAYTVKYAGAAQMALSSGDDGKTSLPASGGTAALSTTPRPVVTDFQAWPNPFNPVVRISFELDRPVYGQLSVYDISGRRVVVLAKGQLDEGLHILLWGGRDSEGNLLSSGTYIARLEAEGASQSLKLVLLR
jgi:beta-lactamase superfamily II metal-dependent hydrolase